MTWIGSLLMGTAKTGLNVAGRVGSTALSGGFLGRAMLGAGIGAIGGLATDDSSSMSGKLGSITQWAFLGALAGGGLSAAQKAIPAIAKNIKWGGAGGAFIKTAERHVTKSFGFKRIMPTGEIYAQKRIIPNVVEQYKTMGWLPNGAINATSKGIGLTGQIIAHPLITAGAIGAGVAAYKMGNLSGGYDRSPTLTGQTTGGVGVRANYDQQAMAAELMTTQMAPTGDIGGAGQMYGAQAQRSFMGSTMGLVQGLSRSRH